MGTPIAANDWTDEYESIVEFYFWEPQHLNRRAPPGRNPGIDEVLQRLRRKEVPLNHLLGILFRLVPASLGQAPLCHSRRPHRIDGTLCQQRGLASVACLRWLSAGFHVPDFRWARLRGSQSGSEDISRTA